jgi:hypothetical protein
MPRVARAPHESAGRASVRRCDPALPETRPVRADNGDGINPSRIDPAGPR